MRRAKIVATLGPATGTSDRIAALIEGGANVIRVNASHGTAETRGRWIEVVRRAAHGAGLPGAGLAGPSGPRLPLWRIACGPRRPPRGRAGVAPQAAPTGHERATH